MKKVFYSYLNPAGSNYSARIKTYKNLAEADPKEITHWLENNCNHADIMSLLTAYMLEEFHAEEDKQPKIRISQEQFDEYFRIIKPHAKKDDEKREDI